MPHQPLLPVLRVGVVLAIGGVLLYCPKKRAPAVENVAPVGVWATDVNGVPPGLLRVGEKATGPRPGQKRPPCSTPLEVEALGACWIPHKKAPPCALGSYEHAGDCLIPVAPAPRMPTSIEP